MTSGIKVDVERAAHPNGEKKGKPVKQMKHRTTSQVNVWKAKNWRASLRYFSKNMQLSLRTSFLRLASLITE